MKKDDEKVYIWEWTNQSHICIKHRCFCVCYWRLILVLFQFLFSLEQIKKKKKNTKRKWPFSSVSVVEGRGGSGARVFVPNEFDGFGIADQFGPHDRMVIATFDEGQGSTFQFFPIVFMRQSQHTSRVFHAQLLHQAFLTNV